MRDRTFLLLAVAAVCVPLAYGGETGLIVFAGQSNAQGWMGDAERYPADRENLDSRIPLYYHSPGIGSSGGKWTTLGPQKGRFPKGHFGPEVSAARQLLKAGYHPAVFKYTLGATSIDRNWKGPGGNGLYDHMVAALKKALKLLRARGDTVTLRGFVWIQGESDAQNKAMADAYYGRLKALLTHFRGHVANDRALPIILGVDEQHPFVVKHPQVVQAQQKLAADDARIVYTTLRGLPKADATHLTPAALVGHGSRIFNAYQRAMGVEALARRHSVAARAGRGRFGAPCALRGIYILRREMDRTMAKAL